MRILLPMCFGVLATVTTMAGAQAPVVQAGEHSCAELGKMIKAAGTVQIYARNQSDYSSEEFDTRSYVADQAQCANAGERPSLWRIYAANDEVCENTRICLPFTPSGR